MQDNFLKTISKYQADINKDLEIFFDKEIKQSKSPFFTETLKMLRDFSLRPGKRIRAILINYGYFIAGGKDEKNIFKTSIFIELIHNFLLIHDDIMDREETRRGKISLHRQYEKSSKFKKDSGHFGTAMALSAGDLMEFLARKILDQSNFFPDKKNKAGGKLNQILEQTACGQMFEFWLRDKFKNGEKINTEDIFKIYKIKTALYTFVGPMQIGGILAGANNEILKSFEEIGTPLGIAFQIQDDLQDFSKDVKEGQPSLAVLKPKGECQQMAKDLIIQAKKQILSANLGKEGENFLLGLADYILNQK